MTFPIIYFVIPNFVIPNLYDLHSTLNVANYSRDERKAYRYEPHKVE